MNNSCRCQNCNKRRTWSDRLETGREINRRGTPSTVSKEFLYKTSPLRTLCVPSEVNLVSEGVRFDPWPHDFFCFYISFLLFSLGFTFFFTRYVGYVPSKTHMRERLTT